MKILLATLAGLGAAKTKTECEACKELQKGIEKNLEKTRNQNFGGGNSKWEESRLGKNSLVFFGPKTGLTQFEFTLKFVFSEIRKLL